MPAHLDLDTYWGQAWVGLRLRLGDAPGLPHLPQAQHQHVKTKNGPTRERRRAIRADARHKEAEEATKLCNVAEETTDNPSDYEIANESVNLAEKATYDHAEATTDSEVPEEAIEGTEEDFFNFSYLSCNKNFFK